MLNISTIPTSILLLMMESERRIISSKKFLRLNQISLAVDYTLQADTAQSRYTHSIEVANVVQIMNQNISLKLGINLDYRGAGRIVGLLHDIGHTAFGHLGERTLNGICRAISNNKIGFEGNSNNYITIDKNRLLDGMDKETRNYILASLAKHPEELYPEQSYLKKIIERATLEDSLYLRNNGFKLKENLSSTIQCQIMDVADENAYIISDIVDSLNILSKKELKEIFENEIPEKCKVDFTSALTKGKNSFRMFMNNVFIKFVENFTFNENGVLVAIDQDLEELRNVLAGINRKYVLNNPRILELRAENKVILETVFNYHFNSDGSDIPSSFYKRQFFLAKTREEKIKVIRNMCGSFTDKGIKMELKRISKGEL